jgi:superfamily I DNA and/or RNA helicase/very-short-patch-repair endonuclease
MGNINSKLEYWKRRLLDLGKRNRLINCPLPTSTGRISRTSILISQPNHAEMWSLFAKNEQTLEFPTPISVNADDNEDVKETFLNNVITNQSLNEAHKTLRNIMRKAKEFAEEKGLNALYLAFGFLNWKENGKDGQELRSPLLLVPVKLTQEDLSSPILLSRLDEEITTNYSLEQKLLNDFNVELPALTNDTNLDEYLNKVKQIVKSLGWSVSTDVTQLLLLSFMKINIYRDLEQNTGRITEHHIVHVLNGEPLSDDTDISDITRYNHDDTNPQEVFSVIDADSSQQDAILLAKRGVSFVLQGPPGTGKSQTITNIIAELIADGKKVLFVSEKMAALEVVYKRLTQAGLADFCLTLHSHNAKRREILGQFERSLKISRQRVGLQQDAFDNLHRLKETRSGLNSYSKELHTVVEPLGNTIYQVNGYLAELENYPNIDYIQTKAKSFTPNLFAQCKTALEELTRVVSKSGYQENNPWGDCILTQITHVFRQQFRVDADNLEQLLNEGLSIFAKTDSLLNTKYHWNFQLPDEIQKLQDFAKTSPHLPAAWLSLNLPEIRSHLEKCIKAVELQKESARLLAELDSTKLSLEDLIKLQIAIIERIEQLVETERQKENQAVEKYQIAFDSLVVDNDEDILTIDADTYLLSYRDNYRTFLRWFISGYRKAHKVLLSYRKTSDKLSYADELALLDKVVTVKKLNTEANKQSEVVKKAEQLLADTKLAFDSCEKTFSFSMLDDNCRKTTVLLGFVGNKLLYTEELNLLDKIETIKHLKVEAEKKAEAVNSVEQLLANTKAAFDDCSTALSALHFEENCKETGALLGIELNSNANFEDLKLKIEWTEQFSVFIKHFKLGQGYINKVCNAEASIFEQTASNLSSLYNWQNKCKPYLDKFANLFSEQRKKKFYELPLNILKTQLVVCRENYAALEYLIDYRAAEKKVSELRINAYLNKAKEINLSAKEIIPVFEKCFFRSWLDAVMPRFAALNEFRRLRHDERIELFKSLDKQHMKISNAMLMSRLVSRLPNLEGFNSSYEVALLNREMAKQRKLMPIRKLIAALPNLLPVLKPCVMMSPLSVSTYLGSSNFEFDTIIFDEASQVRTEDGIGAIFRGKQTIIAGDSKQLPPTDFFSSSISSSDEFQEDEEGEIDDTGAYESLLDEATLLPTRTLLWHYRSRHEDLITFSNTKIYQGKLITFPSSVEKLNGMGVQYVHVSGGTYDRGGKNGNKAEAAKVAELVFEHFRQYPNRSLGIIAFGEVQQAAIDEAINEKRRENLTFEPFFKEDKEESLFIKNLETVQGDERDTIIFSIGYAPDPSGKFVMNFGPLSRNGGERRLNVAVTRARYNVQLVGSILPTDIDLEHASGQGPKLLRLYIDFALNGTNAILGKISANNELSFYSPFETSVYNFLTENGFDVATKVGCSDYRIDMAVRHPKYKGRFAIGIECDGVMYHSARTARERDRLRQVVLEDMGWKIYRVWSTSWIKDRNTEGNHLLEAVKHAVDNCHENVPISQSASNDKSADFLNVTTLSVDESIREGLRQKSKEIRSSYYGLQAEQIPYKNFAETMLKVLSSSFGLDKAGLFKETASYGYGWQRQGSTITHYFDKAFRSLIKQNKIKIDENGKIKIT